MAQVGDRVEVKAKTGTRAGVVIGVSGSLLRLRWDTGEETTLVPAPGVLRVLSAKKRPAPTGKSSPTKKTTPARPIPVAARGVDKKIAPAAGGATPRQRTSQSSERDLSAAERTDNKKKKSNKDKKKKR